MFSTTEGPRLTMPVACLAEQRVQDTFCVHVVSGSTGREPIALRSSPRVQGGPTEAHPPPAARAPGRHHRPRQAVGRSGRP
jgi:hypothetical protein